MSSLLKSVLHKLVIPTVYDVQHIKFYGRWVHRRPLKVLTPEEFKNTEEKHLEDTNNDQMKEEIIDLSSELDFHEQKMLNTQKKHNLMFSDGDEIKYKIVTDTVQKKKEKVRQQKKKTTDMLDTLIDSEGNFIYTKLGNNDPVINSVMVLVKSRKHQTQKELVLLEGKSLIREALKAKCKMENLLFSRKSDVESLVPYLPKSGGKIYKMRYQDIQMWSNLTTSPGIMGIFQTPEVEKFEPPTNSLPLTVICDNIRESGNLGAILRVCAGVGCRRILLTKGCADLWDTKVTRSGAGAHFMLQIHRKLDWPQINDLTGDSASVFIADNNVVNENLGDNKFNVNDTTLSEIVNKIPVVPYYSVHYQNNESFTLIIGGETEGISEESYKYAAKFGGLRLNIPLHNNINSLNAGTALGIIAFEIKKQLV